VHGLSALDDDSPQGQQREDCDHGDCLIPVDTFIMQRLRFDGTMRHEAYVRSEQPAAAYAAKWFNPRNREWSEPLALKSNLSGLIKLPPPANLG